MLGLFLLAKNCFLWYDISNIPAKPLFFRTRYNVAGFCFEQ